MIKSAFSALLGLALAGGCLALANANPDDITIVGENPGTTIDPAQKHVVVVPTRQTPEKTLAESDLARGDMSVLENSDLFHYFHLVRMGNQLQAGKDEVITLYTTSGQFHDLIILAVITDTHQQKIHELSTVISRQFIENHDTAAFARDYAKSFLLAALSLKSQADATGLVREIWEANIPGIQQFDVKDDKLANRELPASSAAAAPASDGYRVYTGKLESTTVPLNDDTLLIMNTQDATQKVPVLRMDVIPKN